MHRPSIGSVLGCIQTSKGPGGWQQSALGKIVDKVSGELRDEDRICSPRVLEATVKILDSIMSEMGNQCKIMSRGVT